MQSTLRTKIAAGLMLALPLGAALVSTPAAAEHREDWRWQRQGYWRDYRDVRAPQIYEVTPDNGDRVGDRGWTRIGARFDDQGSGIAAVFLRVDGRDVTGASRIREDRIRYADDLQPGRHFAELVVRDRAGNVARRAWSFDVVDNDRWNGWGWDRDDGAYGQPQRW